MPECCRLVLPLAALLLSACNWVDSAGSNQSNEPPSVVVSSTAPGDDSGSEQGLPDTSGQPVDDAAGPVAEPLVLAVQEQATVAVSAVAEDTDGSVQSVRWNELPVAQGALEACRDVNGFDMERAAADLAAACSVSGCTPEFDNGSDTAGAAARLQIALPALRAPVGLSYDIIATDDQGGRSTIPIIVCAVSVNEAPEALDDSFSVLEGSVLEVTPDTLNLLSNDTDDIDTSNEPLRVLAEPVTPPVAASVFDLREDGGFTYAFTGVNLTSDIIDRFTYAVTDGSFTSTATATIRIVQRDDPPELDRPLPELEAIEGLAFQADLAPYFSDPEGADLGFDLIDGALPPSGALELSPIGLLDGTPQAGDAGRYELIISASDGTLNTEADLALSVLQNQPVEAEPIPDQSGRARRRIRFGVGRYFDDPEGVSLVYRLTTRGPGLNLTIDTRSGVISGVVNRPGRYQLTVTASDGFTSPAESTVDLRIRP